MSDQRDLFDALNAESAGAPPARVTEPPIHPALDASPPRPAQVPRLEQHRLRTQPVAVLVLPFPLVARVGKIRDVAAKMVATKSPRHAEAYRGQVTEALRVNLTSKRVPTELHATELRQFWQAVDIEVARILNPTRRPGGGTA